MLLKELETTYIFYFIAIYSLTYYIWSRLNCIRKKWDESQQKGEKTLRAKAKAWPRKNMSFRGHRKQYLNFWDPLD